MNLFCSTFGRACGDHCSSRFLFFALRKASAASPDFVRVSCSRTTRARGTFPITERKSAKSNRFTHKAFKILSDSSDRQTGASTSVSGGGGGEHADAMHRRSGIDRDLAGGASVQGGKDGAFLEPHHGEQRGHVSSAEETAIAQVCFFTGIFSGVGVLAVLARSSAAAKSKFLQLKTVEARTSDPWTFLGKS